MKKESEQSFRKGLWYAFRYLRLRDRTEWEIRTYLTKKVREGKLADPPIDEIIKELEHLELLNDRRFVRRYITTQNKVRPVGSKRLKFTLRKLGIASELIDEVCPEENNHDREVQLALTALKRKRGLVEGVGTPYGNNKALQFLLRRGFSYSVSMAAISNTQPVSI